MPLKDILLTPGPSQVPERVRLKLAESAWYHRSKRFRSLYQETRERAQRIFGAGASDVLVFAHWRLDEAEGNVAHDDAGDKDGALHGDPNWLTAGGRAGGALDLDGIDDYIGTDYVLDPADGPFSVYAWKKGGGPQQIVISQGDGTGRFC